MIVAKHAQCLVVCATCLSISSCDDVTEAGDQSEVLRQIEIERLQSLVEADLKVATVLHADDFQLITPNGGTFTKEQYLGSISDGSLDYITWEPTDISVRLYGQAAAIRYSDSEFLVAADGVPAWSGTLHHTNIYEKRGGVWVIVWSQASGSNALNEQE